MESSFKGLNIGDYVKALESIDDGTNKINYGVTGIITGSNANLKKKNIIIQDFSEGIGYPQIVYKKSKIKLIRKNKYSDFVSTLDNIELDYLYLYDCTPIKILNINKEDGCLKIVELLEVDDIPKNKWDKYSFNIYEKDLCKLIRVEKYC